MVISYCKKCETVTERYADGRCKPCGRARALKSYNERPTQRKSTAQAWKEKNRERARRHGRKGGRMDWLPGEHEKAEIARERATSCDVCNSPNPRHKRGWNADHSHATKRFRGIVCHPCNIAISHVENYGLDRGEQIAVYLKGRS